MKKYLNWNNFLFSLVVLILAFIADTVRKIPHPDELSEDFYLTAQMTATNEVTIKSMGPKQRFPNRLKIIAHFHDLDSEIPFWPMKIETNVPFDHIDPANSAVIIAHLDEYLCNALQLNLREREIERECTEYDLMTLEVKVEYSRGFRYALIYGTEFFAFDN